MAGFGSVFDEYAQREGTQAPPSGVAAPSGYAQSYGSVFDEYMAAEGTRPPSAADMDMSSTFRSWYTGQNLGGTANGWDTEFVRQAQAQYDVALDEGRSLTRFEDENALGVVTWDGAKDSQGKALKFGDIVAGGKLVGNVYEDVDRHTANVLMGEWTIQDGDLKARLNAASDPDKAWNDEIDAIRRANTDMAEFAPRAKQFEEDVEERAEDQNVGLITTGGAAGGAAVGAGIGAFFGGVGAVPGALIGGVLGGVGAWLNQDSLAYQIAREKEKLDAVREQNANIGYGGQLLSSMAQTTYAVGLSPFANLVQGIADVGSGFDASSGGEFYATNEEGERVKGGLWQVAEVVSRIGDSMLTFAHPLGRSVYTAQMTAGIAGRGVGLAPGVGTWDDQRLRLDSVWTDEEGNRDWGAAAAGVGNVAVEAVQLGGVRGLFAPLRQTAGRKAESSFFERLNLSRQQRTALKEGGELEQVAGWKFVIDKQGQVVGKGKTTLSMLAPSEALQSLSAKAIARREAARQRGAVDAERLYQAAYELSVGEKAVQTALVNAFGEAQEEGLQTILEPLSHNSAIDPEEVFRAAAAGFASGLGMGIAARVTGASADDRMYETAAMAHSFRTGGDALSKDDWDDMTQLQKRTLVRSAQLTQQVMKGAYESLERNRTASVQGGVVEAAVVTDWWKKASTARLQTGTRATDASHTIVMLDDARFRSDAIATSHTQLLTDQRNRTLGIQTQLEYLTKDNGELARVTREAAADPADQDKQARLAELTDIKARLEQMLGDSRWVEREISTYVDRIDAFLETGDTVNVRRLIDDLNAKLQSWFDMDNGVGFTKPLGKAKRMSLAKAVSRVATRHPEDSTASFTVFVPQVDEFFAVNQANGVAAVSQLTNKGMRSDFDGDKVHTLQQLVLNDKEYIDLRSGTQLLGAELAPEIGTTKAEEHLFNELRVVLNSGNPAYAGLAEHFGNQIEASLRYFYDDPGDPANGVPARRLIPSEDLTAVMKEVRETIRAGGDVRETLLTEMMRRAQTDLLAISRGEVEWFGQVTSNQFFVLANMVTEHLQEFQAEYAARQPRPQGPAVKNSAPARLDTNVKTRRGIMAATAAQQMTNVLPGDNLFRMFQKLHYELMSSTEKWIGWSDEASDVGFRQLAEFYEQLSRDADGLAYDAIPAGDEIVQDVLGKLSLLAKDPAMLRRIAPGMTQANNMALLANVETARWVWDVKPEGTREKRYTGERVTLAQQLLYQSAEQLKVRKEGDGVWESDLDVQATYRKMIELSKPPKQKAKRQAAAERAFLEVFEAAPIYDLVGQDAAALGITETLGQYFRRILDLSPEERAAEQAVLRGEPAYLGKVDGEANKSQTPYPLQDVAGGQVTSFRTLVDSVFSGASATVSRTQSGATKGKVTGHYKDTSDDIETEIAETHAQVRLLMQKWRPQQSYTADDVRDFINANPDVGVMMLRGIPENLMPIVYKGDVNGLPLMAEWYYAMFAEQSSTKAAWMLRWNTWIDGWQAIVGGLDLDEDAGDVAPSYERLGSRFHRVMLQLANQDVADSHFLQELLVKGETFDSTEAFMNWLNNESGLVTTGAPLIAWMDDTADFDATKTGSGWTQTKSTAQLRENWRALRTAIDRKFGEINEREAREVEDGEYLLSLRRGMKAATAGLRPGQVASPDDEARWAQFKAAIANAETQDIAFGPRAMVIQTAIMAFGIYGQAHTKGANPEFLAAVEQAEAMLGAFGYTVNLERLIGDLTTHDEGAVAAAPELVAKAAGRLMDADGQMISWSQPDPEQLLALMESDSKFIDLVVTMLAPQTIELGYNNQPRRQALHGLGLKALLNATSRKDRYPDDGRPGLTASMKYLTELESKLRRKDPFAVQRRVTELVTARTSGLDHVATFDEIQSMTVQAYMDMATALQAVGRIQAIPGQPDPLIEVWDSLLDSRRLEAAQRIYGVNLSDERALGKDKTVEFVKAQLTERYDTELQALKAELRKTKDPTRRKQLTDYQQALRARWKSEQMRLEQLLDKDVVGMTVDTYLFDAKMDQTEKDERKDLLMDFVLQNGDVLGGAGDAAPFMQTIQRYWYENPSTQAGTYPDLTDKQWTTLSQAVISLHVAKLVSVGAAENSPPLYPTESETGKLDKARYWDYTWSYLADFVNPAASDTQLLAVAREHARSAGRVATELAPSEVTRILDETIFRKDSLGDWTPGIPIQGIEQYELMTGASSSVAISMAGLLTQRHSATAAATRRTLEMPPDNLFSRADLTWNEVNWEYVKDPDNAFNPYVNEVEILHPNGRAVERPMIQLNKRFAKTAVVSYRNPLTGADETLDLMTDNATAPWGPAFDDPTVSKKLRIINLDRIRDRVEQLADEVSNGDADIKQQVLESIDVSLEFLHPDMQPESQDYYHNLWFEGTVFDSAGDVSESLLYSLWFGAGGINAQVQQAALDTRKLGLAGIENYDGPNKQEIADLEGVAEQDFMAMLSGKTRIAMTTKIAKGEPLAEYFYNAVFKLMKLKHWVDGTDQDGNRVRLTAEQVIARQNQFGPGYWDEQGRPLRDTSLWIPSDQVLAEVMGEQGYGGVPNRTPRRPLSINTDDIPTFRGWPADSRISVQPQPPKSWADTLVAHTVRLSEPQGNIDFDPVQRDKFKEKAKSFRFHRARVNDERQQQKLHGFDPARTVANAVDTATTWLNAQDITLQFDRGLEWAQVPGAQSVASSRSSLLQYVAAESAKTGNNLAGWVYDYQGDSNPFAGLLSSLDDARGRLSLGPGDLVVVNFASFYKAGGHAEARAEAMKVIEFLASQNVTVVPLASNGPSNLATEMSAVLRSQYGYERYQDNPRILVPGVMQGRRFQNAAAAQSHLSTSSGVTIRKQRILALLKDRPVEENTLLASMRRRSRFDSVQYRRGLLPLNVAAHFGVPQTAEHLSMVRRHLEGLNTASGKEFLANQLAKGKKAPTAEQKAEFIEAYDRLMGRIDRAIRNGTTLPQRGETFGTGDIIPLLSPDGELLLYRHGYKFPYDTFREQLGRNEPGKSNPRNVAVYSPDPLPGASTYTGRVAAARNKQKFGLELELEIDSKALGSKQVFEVNGMKWLISGVGEQFTEPEAPLMGSGNSALYVDGYGSFHDARSKQATENIVLNMRNAFTLFGADFLPKIARALGVTDSQALEVLRAIERAPGKRTEKETKELQDLVSGSSAAVRAMLDLVPQLKAESITVNWESVLEGDTLDSYSLRAMLLYLTTEGASLDAVLYSSGLHVDVDQLQIEREAQSLRMPRLFTRMFDLAQVGSTVRTELFEEFNTKLGREGGSEWVLGQDWTLTGIAENGERIEAVLDFGEAHVSDDNPEMNVQAQDRKLKQGSSMHASLVTEFGLGGDLFPNPKVMRQINRALEPGKTKLEAGELWRSFTRAPRETFGPGSVWQRNTPQEVEYHGLSMLRMLQYMPPIDWAQEGLNEGNAASTLLTKRQDVIAALGWDESQMHVIDHWIRQLLWKPAAAPGQTNYDDTFYANEVEGALDKILSNLEDGLFPTMGAAGPHQISETDLRVMRNAALRNPRAWRPRRRMDQPGSEVDPNNYGEWIAASFGQAWNSTVEVHEVARLDHDGFMNSYRSILKQQGKFMDVSMDKELQGKLLDDATNELLAFSTSPVERAVLMNTVILPRLNLGLDALRYGQSTAESLAGFEADTTWESHSRRRRADFMRKNKIRPKEPTTARDYVQYGAKVLDSNADMHSLSRILMALRHGTTMLNPGLYISMIPEQAFRLYLRGVADVLSGESSGRVAGNVTARFGLNQFTPELVQRQNRLVENLAADNTFAGSIIKDLMYQQPRTDAGGGRIVRAFEKFAQVGNKWQDPTWGTPQKALARTYVDSVIRAVQARPISNVMTVDQIIDVLERDHGYFAKKHPEIHQIASNNVIDNRGLKNTIFSLALKSLYEPLTRSSSGTLQFAGTLLRLPLMYANFSTNMLVTLTGTQGWSQALATYVDGRQTVGTLMHRMSKKLKGEKLEDADDIRYDMSSTMDGYTIANAFIRGGVTQTSLFTLGMVTGGLLESGLGGEDEEARRRRRLAQAQDVPLLADPRRLEADFRNKDLFFLDWLPPFLEPLQAYATVVADPETGETRSAMKMSWLMKPFLSPILGMEKFFQTGDFGWVTYGFYDAVGSLPVVNKGMWDDAVRSVDELTAMAEEQQDLGTPESTRNTMYLLISAVGVYERMLFENMFVNSIYTGFDQYDRDATALPLRDSDGDIQRTLEGEPRPNDLALETFLDEDGNIAAGYQNRDEWSKLMAYYTKNNFSAMAALSLFTGFREDLNRYAMPVKTREIELPQITQDEAADFIGTVLATEYAKNGGPQVLSLQEITKALSKRYAEAGNWDAYNNVDAEAASIFADQRANPAWNPLSVLDKDGQEVLTTNGAAAVISGITSGLADLESPALQGIAIPFEMREQLQADFLEDVTQEGVDMGLTNTQAVSRAKRLFYGPYEDPSITGFADVLWSDKIPYSPKRAYKQLNTTYVTGPDGYPWATGFKRGGVLNQLGAPQRINVGDSGATTTDRRLNTVDLVAGINTGMRGLVPFHTSENVPTDKEIGDAIVKAIEDLELKGSNFEPFDNKSSSGRFRGGYRRYPRRSYGGGGGYSSSPRIYFTRQPYLGNGRNVYGDSARNIFWDTPTIRRSTIRRERYTSQRGRLNQWQ